jgi:hypothetical protein
MCAHKQNVKIHNAGSMVGIFGRDGLAGTVPGDSGRPIKQTGRHVSTDLATPAPKIKPQSNWQFESHLQ